jgi:hypothetical protein
MLLVLRRRIAGFLWESIGQYPQGDREGDGFCDVGGGSGKGKGVFEVTSEKRGKFQKKPEEQP